MQDMKGGHQTGNLVREQKVTTWKTPWNDRHFYISLQRPGFDLRKSYPPGDSAAVTFSSPIVGGHLTIPKRVTWTHHPKKVTNADFARHWYPPNWFTLDIYHLYTTYILPIGWLYITYHLLREPETAIDDISSPVMTRLHRMDLSSLAQKFFLVQVQVRQNLAVVGRWVGSVPHNKQTHTPHVVVS